VEETGARHERVVGEDVDVLRSGPVRGRRDRREQLAVLRLAVDDERVARANRERRLDDCVGVAGE
jgi:hypothetical protein